MCASLLPKLIVGLGNPGPEYEATRHNAGFLTIEALLARVNGPVSQEHRYDTLLNSCRYAGRALWFARPLTYMNASGPAVGKLVRVLDLLPEELLVIYDCLDLPLGRIRLRQSGSSGGHRGMESIIRELETGSIPRLRIGIGRETGSPVIGHVLSAWAAEEQAIAETVIATAAEAVLQAVRRGVAQAMNKYNAWSVDGDGTGASEQGDKH